MEVRYLEKLLLRDLKPDYVFIEILFASVTARDPDELTKNVNGFIPCSDASAVIRAVGENVQGFQIGDRVCPTFWGETGVLGVGSRTRAPSHCLGQRTTRRRASIADVPPRGRC